MASGIITVATGVTTGHGGFPPTTPTSGSSDVTAGGSGLVREGDTWATHCYKKSCHTGVTIGNTNSVYANGLLVAMVGGKLTCGDTIASGVTDVTG